MNALPPARIAPGDPRLAARLRRETRAEVLFRPADRGRYATDAGFQAAIAEVREAGLNIMMSMKGDGKPVSFIEDCAVGLDDLADYTEKLNDVFTKHGTKGTWYAHASVGCLHVRPVLNMKDGADVAKMRAIAEECFALVREYKGSHSGEHGAPGPPPRDIAQGARIGGSREQCVFDRPFQLGGVEMMPQSEVENEEA